MLPIRRWRDIRKVCARFGAVKVKKHILFVDDESNVLDSLRRMLRRQQGIWKMTFINRSEEAWERLQAGRFDAIVTDVKMPGISGLQLLQLVQESPATRDIPVVVLTGLLDRVLKRRALDLGATDLLSKPVELEDLLARLRNVLRLKSYRDELRAANDSLEHRVHERTEELTRSRLDIIWRLGKVAEHRDVETGNHVIRVGSYSRVIAEAMWKNRGFVETLFLAAPLHDIGKIGIPDSILLRRGPLSPGQRKQMEKHCEIGTRILRDESRVRTAFQEWRGANSQSELAGYENPFLETAASIALAHHEKWDGSGYPQGLSGEQIPLEARIVAISDVFDALTSKRPYKEPHSERHALQILREAEGKHFDPDVYSAFLEALPEIQAIRKRFADEREISPQMEDASDEKMLLKV
jgi:putative two-component system response regulator